MKITAGVLGILLAGAVGGSAMSEDAAGHWYGTIKAPGDVDLTIVAHIKAGAGGALEGYAESPDQVLTPIPMANIKAAGDTLAFAAPSVNAAFAGRWDPGAKGWVGALTQNGLELPLTLVRGSPPPRPVIAGVDGDWSGVLQAPQGDLRIKLHVKSDAEGTVALFESPDQSPIQMVATVARNGDTMTFELKGVGRFEGKLSANGQTADGEWRQGGGAIPLVLRR